MMPSAPKLLSSWLKEALCGGPIIKICDGKGSLYVSGRCRTLLNRGALGTGPGL